MTDNKSIINRLRSFAKIKKGSVLQFEIDLGFSEGYIKSIYQKSSALGIDKLVQIYTIFPDLNIKWLLTGVGDMIEKGEKVEKNIAIQMNVGEYAEKVKGLEAMIAKQEKEIDFLRELLKSKT